MTETPPLPDLKQAEELAELAIRMVEEGDCSLATSAIFALLLALSTSDRLLAEATALTPRTARAHVDVWAEQKARAQVAETLLAEAVEALEGMVNAYWRGSEDSDDVDAPSMVQAAIQTLAKIKEAQSNGR